MITLGLDIGSNSVGSAWVDTDAKTIHLGVSVFPAGVDETDTKRGAPLGRKRREKRSQRRSIARRAERKHRLRRLLTEVGLSVIANSANGYVSA
jgi:CRISPR/Cas system Type II protein with McrA/HNH and RuvC-like nuclease domain